MVQTLEYRHVYLLFPKISHAGLYIAWEDYSTGGVAIPAPWNPPKRAEDFELHIALEDFLAPGNFKSSPTIAAGDFQISKDGGTFANLATLPVVEPASSQTVLIALSATEMTADSVVVRAVDQTAPKEWADFILSIPTTA